MSMQDEHVTEVDHGSDVFKQVQDMLDATCMEKMCGLGRDVKHKQIKHFPYNRLEAVRVYHLNNSLTLDIYNATKSMIYKYSRRTTPGDDELPLISDSVLTTRCELSKCSLQRDVNEVFLFHGTSGDILPTIIDHGIDEHYFRLTGLFGAGCYFSDQSSKADQYGTPVPFKIVQELEGRCRRSRAATANQTPEQEKSKCIPNAKDATAKRLPLTKDDILFPVFVARVTLGDPVGTPSEPVEPQTVDRLVTKMHLSHPEKFFRTAKMVAERWGKKFVNKYPKHSVIGRGKVIGGNAKDGLEYVVYQKAQSYPEYLVLYKRTIYDDVNDVLTGWFYKLPTRKGFKLGMRQKRFFVLSKSKREIAYYQDETRAVLKNKFKITYGSRLERDEKTDHFTIIKPDGTRFSATMLHHDIRSTHFINWINAMNELCSCSPRPGVAPNSFKSKKSSPRAERGTVMGSNLISAAEVIAVDGESQQRARDERRWNDFRLFVGKQWCKFRPAQLQAFQETKPKFFSQDEDLRWFYVTSAITNINRDKKAMMPLLPVGVLKKASGSAASVTAPAASVTAPAASVTAPAASVTGSVTDSVTDSVTAPAASVTDSVTNSVTVAASTDSVASVTAADSVTAVTAVTGADSTDSTDSAASVTAAAASVTAVTASTDSVTGATAPTTPVTTAAAASTASTDSVPDAPATPDSISERISAAHSSFEKGKITKEELNHIVVLENRFDSATGATAPTAPVTTAAAASTDSVTGATAPTTPVTTAAAASTASTDSVPDAPATPDSMSERTSAAHSSFEKGKITKEELNHIVELENRFMSLTDTDPYASSSSSV